MFFSDSNTRDTALRIIEDVELNLSKFFGTLAIVNLCLGFVVVTMTWFLGLPHPLLWGVLAATLNFIPYLGPAIMIAALFVIGLMNFQTLGQSLLAPIAYLSITTIEGQFLTPTIIGHRLTLNPFLVFLSIAFWAWMWGPIGAFLATPLLISAVIAVRHVSSEGEFGQRLTRQSALEMPPASKPSAGALRSAAAVSDAIYAINDRGLDCTPIRGEVPELGAGAGTVLRLISPAAAGAR